MPASISHSSNRLLSDEDFNTQFYLTLFSNTKRALTINVDLIHHIFSFLQPTDFCAANLINKTCYVAYHTPHLKVFEWIFFSSVIKQHELKHPSPLLQFNDDGSCSLAPVNHSMKVSPAVLVMDRYVKYNYWKQFIDLLSSGKELVYSDIFNQCRLAADQGHEPATKLFIELYLLGCSESYNEGEENHKEFLKAIYRHANHGSESAIRFLLTYFTNSDTTCSSTQSERLNLIKKYADQGSEAAIKHLLGTFRKGLFGINASDKEVQITCLKLAQNYIDKFQSEAAISFMLKAYKKSWLGLNWNEISIQNQCMQFAQTYANLESETAIDFLLTTHKTLFQLVQTKEIQQKALLLADYYARTYRSEKAIHFLLEAYNSNSLGLSSSLERRKKRNMLAQKYANQGSEVAVKFLILLKNNEKRYEIAKKYAALKSEKAIKYVLKTELHSHFFITYNEPITKREGWQLAINYLKGGSLTALKMMIYAYQSELDSSSMQ